VHHSIAGSGPGELAPHQIDPMGGHVPGIAQGRGQLVQSPERPGSFPILRPAQRDVGMECPGLPPESQIRQSPLQVLL
jgi:hypothetical protein